MIELPDLTEAAAKVAAFEGFRAGPYLDSAGIPTIGYGTTHYPWGYAVTLADKLISEPMALVYLRHDLGDADQNLGRFVRAAPTMNEWSAILSLAYNVGWLPISRSTLLRNFNNGAISSAAAQFLVWDKAVVDGRLVAVPGLLNRRKAESALFLTPDSPLTNQGAIQ